MEMFRDFMRGIRTIRVFDGITQKELANRAGIKESTYTRFEQNKGHHNPRLDTLIGLAKAVGMNIEEVLEFVKSTEARLGQRNQGETDE